MKLNFTLIATAGLIGVTIALFGLNFWHASKCAESKSPEEIDEYIDALNKRLLEAESQVFNCFHSTGIDFLGINFSVLLLCSLFEIPFLSIKCFT